MLGIAVIMLLSSNTARDNFSYWLSVSTPTEIKREQIRLQNNNPTASVTDAQAQFKSAMVEAKNPPAKMTAAQLRAKQSLIDNN